jgi:hypothetical protein
LPISLKAAGSQLKRLVLIGHSKELVKEVAINSEPKKIFGTTDDRMSFIAYCAQHASL